MINVNNEFSHHFTQPLMDLQSKVIECSVLDAFWLFKSIRSLHAALKSTHPRDLQGCVVIICVRLYLISLYLLIYLLTKPFYRLPPPQRPPPNPIPPPKPVPRPDLMFASSRSACAWVIFPSVTAWAMAFW